MTRAELLGRLAPYRGTEKTLIQNQDTADIMAGIAEWHKRYGHHYDGISALFLGRDAKETARRVFDFLKGNVNYIIEGDDRQTLKTPAAIIAQGHGDCKHYSLFIGGILDSLARLGLQRTPWAFRFASYRWYDETPQHVFVVLNPGTRGEIWVDPVLSRFDQRKPYTHAIDKRMALVGISGVQAPAQMAGLKDILKKGKQVVLKVYAAPSRAAFLALVRLNVFGLANKLYTVWQRNPDNMKKWWGKLGGEINKLTDVIEAGRKKPRTERNSAANAVGSVEGIIAAAAPVLVALIDLFKQNNIDPSEIQAAADFELNKRAQNAAGWEIAPDAFSEGRADAVRQELTDQAARPVPWGIIAAGGLLLFYALRKK